MGQLRRRELGIRGSEGVWGLAVSEHLIAIIIVVVDCLRGVRGQWGGGRWGCVTFKLVLTSVPQPRFFLGKQSDGDVSPPGTVHRGVDIINALHTSVL